MTRSDEILRGVERILRQLGLTEYESRVLAYLSFARSPLKASEISKATGIPRTKVYSTLYSLADAGLVSMKSGRPLLFSTLPPEELPSLLADNVVIDAVRKLSLIKKIHQLEIAEGLWILSEVVLPVSGPILRKFSQFVIKNAKEFLILIFSRENSDLMPKEFPPVRTSLLVDSHEAYSELTIPGPKEVRFGRYDMFAAVTRDMAVISDERIEIGLYISEKRLLKAITMMTRSLYLSGLPGTE